MLKKEDKIECLWVESIFRVSQNALSEELTFDIYYVNSPSFGKELVIWQV